MRPRRRPTSSRLVTQTARAGLPRPRRSLRPWLVGAALLAVAGAVVLAAGGRHAKPARRVVPPTVILHYRPATHDAALPVYRGLLEALPTDRRILVGVAQAEHEASFRGLVGPALLAGRRVTFVRTLVDDSPWIRDRCIPFTRRGRPCLYVPPDRFTDGGGSPPPGLPAALQRLVPDLRIIPSRLGLEGGDVQVTADSVFIGADTVRLNRDDEEDGEAAFRRDAEALFGRSLVVVGAGELGVPYDHIDMFLTALEGRHVLLGDPRLGARLLAGTGAPAGDVLRKGELGLFRRSRQEHIAAAYDGIAADLARRGFVVERLPILHGEEFADGRRGTILNWNNALIDYPGKRAYVPWYGLPALDEAAQLTWRKAGFEPKPIDARAAIVRGGAVRCLTTELGLGATAARP